MSQLQTEIPFDLGEAVNNLVTEDDEPLDNTLSEKQQRLLVEPLYSSWTPPPDEDEPEKARLFWAAANLRAIPFSFTSSTELFSPSSSQIGLAGACEEKLIAVIKNGIST
jgi:hypothetical protein